MTDNNKNANMMRYAGLATQWLVMLLAAVGIGWKLDKWIGPNFHVFIIALPLIALCVSLWQIINEFNKPRSK
ncbi:MAG: AtpZ/AtpI family protein [Flavipsychrobacter sp.]|nr:AtpZ/AtpI family protein [Flavipsychrobacter sp.]